MRGFEMTRFLGRLIGSVAVLACVIGFPSAAQANQIDFLKVGHGAVVSVAGTVRSGTFMAGELEWQWMGAAPEGFAQAFYSYCIDVAHNLADGQMVTAIGSEGFSNGAPNGGAKAAWLFNEFAAGIRANSNVGQANTMAAALQVAIWEAMYDSNPNLGGGSFILSTTGAIRSQAESYLSALYNAGANGYNTGLATVLDVATGASGQDQIVARVTEPSTLLLMGVAFIAFAKRARRSTARRS